MPKNIHFSSLTNEWSTPEDLFDELDREFHFNLDPAATDDNHRCSRYFTEIENGLIQDWTPGPLSGEPPSVVFLNPPYGRGIVKWMAKAHEESGHGATVVCLVPARTDTAWFQKYAFGHEIRFLRGRLKFGAAKTGAPFPSAIVVMRPPNVRRSFIVRGGAR